MWEDREIMSGEWMEEELGWVGLWDLGLVGMKDERCEWCRMGKWWACMR